MGSKRTSNPTDCGRGNTVMRKPAMTFQEALRMFRTRQDTRLSERGIAQGSGT